MELVGPLQLRVMHHLWATGPCTVHQVHEALNGQKGAPKLAYTTILTVMRNLARRKFISQTPNGRAHLFEALVDEQTYKSGVIADMKQTFFAGDVKAFVKMVNQA